MYVYFGEFFPEMSGVLLVVANVSLAVFADYFFERVPFLLLGLLCCLLN